MQTQATTTDHVVCETVNPIIIIFNTHCLEPAKGQ